MTSPRWMLGIVLMVGGSVLSGAGAQTGDPQAQNEYVREGVYGGIGFIYAPSVFAFGDAERALPPSREAGTSLSGNNSWGLDARVGYRIAPRVAVEADYQFAPGFDVERRGAGTETTLRTHTLTVNGKVYAMTDTLQPYAVGGIGLLHVNADRDLAGFSGDGTGFAGRVGVGADYYVRPDVVVNIEFSAVLPTGPVADVRFLPLVFGAQYRF